MNMYVSRSVSSNWLFAKLMQNLRAKGLRQRQMQMQMLILEQQQVQPLEQQQVQLLEQK